MAKTRGLNFQMKFKHEHFCCSPKLLCNIAEISEIGEAIANVAWTGQFRLEVDDKGYEHQTGYNKALCVWQVLLGSSAVLMQVMGFGRRETPACTVVRGHARV